jgi:hypothetical protein
LFDLSPGANHWPKPDDAGSFSGARRSTFGYFFKHHGATILAWVADGDHGTLSIHAICNPSERGRQMIGYIDIEPSDGDAIAWGRLERKDGCYLRELASGDGDYHGTDAATAWLSALSIKPVGLFIR